MRVHTFLCNCSGGNDRIEDGKKFCIQRHPDLQRGSQSLIPSKLRGDA